MSDSTEVKGNWNEQKRKLMQKFPVLTNRDVMYWDGNKEEMLARLQIKLGKTPQELQAIVVAL